MDKVLEDTMASILKDVWNRLTLAGDEEEAAIFEEEMPAEKLEEIKLCLWGKLMTNKQFNARAMKTILKNIWKPDKGVVIKIWIVTCSRSSSFLLQTRTLCSMKALGLLMGLYYC